MLCLENTICFQKAEDQRLDQHGSLGYITKEASASQITRQSIGLW